MKKPENLDLINQSFAAQAAAFESKSMNFTNEDYFRRIINIVKPNNSMTMLEMAAGTCAVSRRFAPFVNMAVCVDATEEMLLVGKNAAEQSGCDNIVFIKEYAEELPFLNSSFDIVISRLAFHHFTDTRLAFAEMARVCKKGGRDGDVSKVGYFFDIPARRKIKSLYNNDF